MLARSLPAPWPGRRAAQPVELQVLPDPGLYRFPDGMLMQ
jgi:hypothetical protein